MSDEYAICVEHLSKAYGLPFDLSPAGLVRAISSKDTALSRRELALKDVSFNVRRGELLGVIGRNGAGKSTLLRVLAGVSPATRGRVELNGSIFPMIELNAGMSDVLTGRENVILLATIMGLTKKHIMQRMDGIEEFCDLGEWFDRPVWQYSSGMPGRLGFAVAVFSEADILLIDEVLAVGDLVFRNRCTEKMLELRESGRTIVLVSHNMSAIAGMCTRTIMLEAGELKFDSLPDVTVQHYKDFVSALTARKLKKRKLEQLEATTTDGFDVHGVIALDERDVPTEVVRGDKPFSLVMDCEVPIEFSDGLLEIVIATEDGQVCVEDRYPVMIEGPPLYRRLTVKFTQGLALREGRYELSMRLNNDVTGDNCITARTPLSMSNKRITAGIVAPRTETAVSSPTIVRSHLPPLVQVRAKA